ncbi:hypothetical protein GGX14DRAFT_404806 [Mycena pura]|uniref:DEAD/DEAH box helicase domain-containing protein n=1 Tax=Mycena pura TaxID=153505 RepID=A0AAD6Y4U7_9AGAR|nr:hypothetical protein GGX14DRAFT_404806 [Mycena pura]
MFKRGVQHAKGKQTQWYVQGQVLGDSATKHGGYFLMGPNRGFILGSSILVSAAGSTGLPRSSWPASAAKQFYSLLGIGLALFSRREHIIPRQLESPHTLRHAHDILVPMLPPWLLQAVFLLWGAAITHAFTFSSPEGFTLVRKILLSALPTFEPHSYQMEGVCKVLDKIDLVAFTPTGSGKTGFLFLTILVMIAITADPSLCPTVTFPKDPVIVVVCPTNSIEQQMVYGVTPDCGVSILLNENDWDGVVFQGLSSKGAEGAVDTKNWPAGLYLSILEELDVVRCSGQERRDLVRCQRGAGKVTGTSTWRHILNSEIIARLGTGSSRTSTDGSEQACLRSGEPLGDPAEHRDPRPHAPMRIAVAGCTSSRCPLAACASPKTARPLIACTSPVAQYPPLAARARVATHWLLVAGRFSLPLPVARAASLFSALPATYTHTRRLLPDVHINIHFPRRSSAAHVNGVAISRLAFNRRLGRRGWTNPEKRFTAGEVQADVRAHAKSSTNNVPTLAGFFFPIFARVWWPQPRPFPSLPPRWYRIFFCRYSRVLGVKRGVFEMLDGVGLDVALDIDNRHVRAELLKSMVDAGNLVIKSGKGFCDHPPHTPIAEDHIVFLDIVKARSVHTPSTDTRETPEIWTH